MIPGRGLSPSAPGTRRLSRRAAPPPAETATPTPSRAGFPEAPVIPKAKYEVGSFWTARQRQADRIHEISYRACFKPQLPRTFIERFTAPGDIVYDPFMGRGTTPVEAALLGRIPYGNDLAPLSRVLTEPRINPPALLDIAARLARIDWRAAAAGDDPDLLAFYHPETLAQLESLRLHLGRRPLDRVDAWIRMVAAARLAGHSPGFFSVRTMPPNQAVAPERQRRLNERSGQAPEAKRVPDLILKKSKSLLSQRIPRAPRSLFLTRRSDDTPEIGDGEISLTVTSPPFLDVVDYARDNWLRNWFLGFGSEDLSVHRDVDRWRRFTRATLKELVRITAPGGRIAYEVGEVRRGRLLLETVVAEAASGLPLTLERVYVNEQTFTKTANCWGVTNNRRGTNTNRIVLFRRA